MAPLTRSTHYALPELSLEAPTVVGKDVKASSYPIALANPDVPRLLIYKSKSGTCPSCSKSAMQSCADCCGMVFYCNADCQLAHWPEHKEACADLKDQHLNEVMEARDKKALIQITNDLGQIISSDFKSLNYKNDPMLLVKIDDFASFGDFYDVSEGTTIRSFHPGTYKCTSVTPDEGCTPVIICHHASVDPVKVMKQCILMSKDFFENTDLPNQITMPDWCNWESADEEYIPDTESEISDSEASDGDVTFAHFVGRVFDDKPAMESDSEDHEYDPSESDSDGYSSESDISDHEINYLIDESKQYIKDIPQKRLSIAPAVEMEVAEDGKDDGAEDGEDAGEDSEVEAYKDFKEKVLESEHKYASDLNDSDYLPYSESDSDSGDSVPERDISDSEKCISDNEVESMIESSKDMRDMDEELYDEFVDNVLDSSYIEESDPEDQDYIPADLDSASSEEDEISDNEEKSLLEESNDLIKNLTEKRQSVQTAFSISSSESDGDSEVSSEEELYEDFRIHTEAKCDLSDTEDLEYIPEQSDSEASSSSDEEMEISDAESDALVDDSKEDVKQVSGQKRKCRPEDEDCQDADNEEEMESDDELYNDFRSKLIVSDPSQIDDLGSDDEEFVPPAESQDSQDESQDDSQDASQDESQDEDAHASLKSEEEMDLSDNEIKDLELSSEEELYEDFKDEVCKTKRKVQAQHVPKAYLPSNNKDIIYFMNSSYTSSLNFALDSDNIKNGSEIAGSFVLKNGSESSGIAVEMKGHTWRSAHLFEDSTSEKYFALVLSTDAWEHLSNNHEHLVAQYPDQKWSSVAETKLKFQMKEYFN